MAGKRKTEYRPLDLSVEGEQPENVPPRRWRSREPNPTVQMSLRMREEDYERFRMNCHRERLTNGEMLKLMNGLYERIMKIADPERRSAEDMLSILIEESGRRSEPTPQET